MHNRFRWCQSVLLIAILTAPVVADSLPMLHAQGSRFVDPADNSITLKGCNLGNWLILESWMLGGGISDNGKPYHDQAQLFHTLHNRFGDDRYEQLMDLYRTGYIEPRDFDLIKSFGFNLVRVPFDYRLLQSDQPPYALKPNAFRWLDRAVDMADAAHIYVVLDMHGVPGGQSGQDHAGESGQNHLWKNDTNKQRAIDLWRAIAGRYKNRATIAAYDLINEPYGDYHTDVRSELADLIPRIATAIRSTGDQHIVFFPGALNGGIAFYGNPHDAGFTNVAFTEHYYPGLFGSTTALETQARILNQEMPIKKSYLDNLGTPYFVGEFNVVLTAMASNEMMRAYYDRFRDYGWAATMWSYKLLTPAGGVQPEVWNMVTNADPMRKLDIHTSSFDDFEKYFASFKTMRLAVNEPLHDALTAANPAPLYLAQFPTPPTKAPSASSNPPGYTSADIGPAIPGSTTLEPDGSLEIYGGGTDIHGTSDSFRFVSHPATATADESAEIFSLLDSNTYAKAGIMARWGDQTGSPMALVNTSPDGIIALVTRDKLNAIATETKLLSPAKFPIELRLKIASGRATAFYRDGNSDWKSAGSAKVPTDPNFQIGIAVCSHVDVALTVAKVRLNPTPLSAPVMAAAIDPSPSLLKNGNFEITDPTNDPPPNWSRSVDEATKAVELYEDVSAEPAKRYSVSIRAQFRPPATGHDLRTIELRLETATPNGIVVLNAQKYDLSKLTTDWTPLTVSGFTISDHVRAAIVITPPPDNGPSGTGTLLLKKATLTLASEY